MRCGECHDKYPGNYPCSVEQVEQCFTDERARSRALIYNGHRPPQGDYDHHKVLPSKRCGRNGMRMVEGGFHVAGTV